MTPSRAAIVATAGETIARGSRSFAAASKLLGRRERERAWLLYAWCRACDDLADGQDHGFGAHELDDGAARLAAIRIRTAAVLDGQWIGDARFDALRFVAAETGMPHALFDDLIEGFALDAAGWRPASEVDLYRYCYHVAGSVGCMMALAMGVPPDAEDVIDRACDLGIGFQLANIARDIAEDHAAGRCYLPAQWLAEAKIPPADLLAPGHRPALAAIAARLCALADRYVASGRTGTPALGFRSAWGVLAAARIYGGIAEKVAAAGESALDRRVSTSGTEKLAAIAGAFTGAIARRTRFAPAPREGLWTRPRAAN